MLKANNVTKKWYLKIFSAFRLPAFIDRAIEDDWTVLDVGCGKQSPLADVKKSQRRLVGLDIYEPYIAQTKKLGIHDEYYVGDIRNLPFEPSSFDCVIAVDVLEHLSKDDGMRMLAEMERVARHKVILTTPNGFLPTYAGPKDNPEESHLSGWTCEALSNLGFTTRGFSGLKCLWTVKNGQAVPKLPIPIFASAIVELSQFCGSVPLVVGKERWPPAAWVSL